MSVALAVALTPYLEEVACYGCGNRTARPFIQAQDDLTRTTILAPRPRRQASTPSPPAAIPHIH